MAVKKLFSIAIVIILLSECTSPRRNYAPEKNYYFSVSASPNNLQTEKLKKYIEFKIPKQKYTITNQSGLTWPYYRAFELDEPVIQDSLMSPHWFIHRMLPLDEEKEIEVGAHLVNIELGNDSILYYHLIVFTQQENGLRLTANTGKHFIDSAHFEKINWPNYLLQSIVRDSFK